MRPNRRRLPGLLPANLDRSGEFGSHLFEDMWKRRIQRLCQSFAKRVWVFDFNRHHVNFTWHWQTEMISESDSFSHTQKMRRMNRQSFDAVDIEHVDRSRRHEPCHDRVNNDRMAVSDEKIQKGNSHLCCFPDIDGWVTGEIFG